MVNYYFSKSLSNLSIESSSVKTIILISLFFSSFYCSEIHTLSSVTLTNTRKFLLAHRASRTRRGYRWPTSELISCLNKPPDSTVSTSTHISATPYQLLYTYALLTYTHITICCGLLFAVLQITNRYTQRWLYVLIEPSI